MSCLNVSIPICMEEIDKVLREFKYGVRLMYSSCGELRERRIFRDDYPKVGRDTLCGENDPSQNLAELRVLTTAEWGFLSRLLRHKILLWHIS